jgi:hypothetical protein
MQVNFAADFYRQSLVSGFADETVQGQEQYLSAAGHGERGLSTPLLHKYGYFLRQRATLNGGGYSYSLVL